MTTIELVRLLHIRPSVGKASFGIGPVVLNTALNQTGLGAKVTVWSIDTKDEIARLEKTRMPGHPKRFNPFLF